MPSANLPALSQPRLALGIATVGRAPILAQTLALLAGQTRKPDRVLVCGVTQADIAGAEADSLETLFAPAGLCSQRNAILRRVGDCDILVFLDDDFMMAPDYLEATLAAFAADPSVMVTTGHVIADGAVGPGFSFAHGLQELAADAGSTRRQGVAPAFNGYGCNMALRLETVRTRALHFDEGLPLYGWFEDVDFTRRLGQAGRIVQVLGAHGVHLGVKTGRTSGRRLGYSQVANPIYLARKGSYIWRRVVRDIFRHVLVNAIKSVRPEPYVDRRGRLAGNVTAFQDLLRGRMSPGRIVDF